MDYEAIEEALTILVEMRPHLSMANKKLNDAMQSIEQLKAEYGKNGIVNINNLANTADKYEDLRQTQKEFNVQLSKYKMISEPIIELLKDSGGATIVFDYFAYNGSKKYFLTLKSLEDNQILEIEERPN